MQSMIKEPFLPYSYKPIYWEVKIVLYPDIPGKRRKLSRKIVKRNNSRCTLKFPSWKMGKMIECDSFLEKNSFTLFDVAINVKYYTEQPALILYMLDGKKHKHYPDALIETVKGKTFIEIKTFKDSEREEVLKRTEHLQRMLPKHGYNYMVLTDRDICKQPRLSNAQYLLRHGRKFLKHSEYIEYRNRLGGKDYLLWGNVLSNNIKPLDHGKVCRLILDKKVRIPMEEVWTENTRLTFIDRQGDY